MTQKTMEPLKRGKHFRLLEENELESVLEILEKHLPFSIKFHQTIKTYIKDKVWDFYFYVSLQWPDVLICLHFPGCTLTPNNSLTESFGVFCPLDQLDHLRLVRSEDILINWSKPIYINLAQAEIINEFMKNYEGEVDRQIGEIYVYDSDTHLTQFERLSNDEVEMRQLASDNVQCIHDLYPAAEVESIEVFEKLIHQLPGCGIFSLKTGELVAWMVQSYYGAMFSMQTKPDHRRKGYGIWLASALTNLVIQRGYLPFVVIRPENSASKGLYTKLGFEKKFGVIRAKFVPANYHAKNGGNGEVIS